MKFQVLVVTMNENDFSILSRMNIDDNVVIANQVSKQSNRVKNKNNLMITTDTKGVGINRNIALANSTADICLLADNDMYYYDGMPNKIIHEFDKNPEADIIIFNVDVIKNNKLIKKNIRINNRKKNINMLNFQNYGAVRIAFRREKIIRNNLWFSVMFGGGAKYSHGEDSLFLREALKKNLKIIASDINIGKTDITESTWFKGYNDKFFYDKGALIRAMFPKLYFFFCGIYYPLRFKNISGYKCQRIAKLMFKGAREYI